MKQNMKVKIIKSSLLSYWYSNEIGNEYEVDYDINHDPNNFIVKFNNKPIKYLVSEDVVITQLPDAFYVKKDINYEKRKWDKYITWINSAYKPYKSIEYVGVNPDLKLTGYYKISGTELHIDDIIRYIDSLNFKQEFDLTTTDGRLAYAKKYYPIGTKFYILGTDTTRIITGEPMYNNNGIYIVSDNGIKYFIYYREKWAEIIKEEIKETNIEKQKIDLTTTVGYNAGFICNYDKCTEIIKEEVKQINMEKQKLSRKGLKEIHSVACPNWKDVLEHYGSRNPLEDYIELTYDEVNKMFKASDDNQKIILSKYLKNNNSVGLSFIHSLKLLEQTYDMIGIIHNGEYKNKAFYLNKEMNWEIKKDINGSICLIPTRK